MRSAPLENVLFEGAGIGAVVRFYTFQKFWRSVVEIENLIGIHCGEICVPQKRSGQGG